MTVREVQELLVQLPEEAEDAKIAAIFHYEDTILMARNAVYIKGCNTVILTGEEIDCVLDEFYEDEEDAEAAENIDWFVYSRI